MLQINMKKIKNKITILVKKNKNHVKVKRKKKGEKVKEKKQKKIFWKILKISKLILLPHNNFVYLLINCLHNYYSLKFDKNLNFLKKKK